jgi:hypothetical protein
MVASPVAETAKKESKRTRLRARQVTLKLKRADLLVEVLHSRFEEVSRSPEHQPYKLTAHVSIGSKLLTIVRDEEIERF